MLRRMYQLERKVNFALFYKLLLEDDFGRQLTLAFCGSLSVSVHRVQIACVICLQVVKKISLQPVY